MTQKGNYLQTLHQQEQDFLRRFSLKKFTVPKDKVTRQTSLNSNQLNDDVLNCLYQEKYSIEYRDLKRSLTGAVPWWLRSKGIEEGIYTERLITLVEKSIQKISSSNCFIDIRREQEQIAEATNHSKELNGNANLNQDSHMIGKFFNLSIRSQNDKYQDKFKEIAFIEKRINRVVKVLNNLGEVRLGSGCEKCNKYKREQELSSSATEKNYGAYDLQCMDKEIESICYCLEDLMKEHCQCSLYSGIIQKLQNIRSSLQAIKENQRHASQEFIKECPQEMLEKMAKFLGYEKPFSTDKENSNNNNKLCKTICPCYQTNYVETHPFDSVLREKNTQRERFDENVQNNTKDLCKNIQDDNDCLLEQRFEGHASSNCSLDNNSLNSTRNFCNEIKELITIKKPNTFPNKFCVSESEIDSEDEKCKQRNKANKANFCHYLSQQKNCVVANKDEIYSAEYRKKFDIREDENCNDIVSHNRNGHKKVEENFRMKNQHNQRHEMLNKARDQSRNEKNCTSCDCCEGKFNSEAYNNCHSTQKDMKHDDWNEVHTKLHLQERQNEKTKFRSNAENENIGRERNPYALDKENWMQKAEVNRKNQKIEYQGGKDAKDLCQDLKKNFSLSQYDARQIEIKANETDRHQRHYKKGRRNSKSPAEKQDHSKNIQKNCMCHECVQKSLGIFENENPFSENQKHTSKNIKHHQEHQRKCERDDFAMEKQKLGSIEKKEVPRNPRHREYRKKSRNDEESEGATKACSCANGKCTFKRKTIVNAHQDNDAIYNDKSKEVKKYSKYSSARPFISSARQKFCCSFQNLEESNHVSDERNNDFKEQRGQNESNESCHQQNTQTFPEIAKYQSRKTPRQGNETTQRRCTCYEDTEKHRHRPYDKKHRQTINRRGENIHTSTKGEACQDNIRKQRQVSGTSAEIPMSSQPQETSFKCSDCTQNISRNLETKSSNLDCNKGKDYLEANKMDIKDQQCQRKEYQNHDASPHGRSERHHRRRNEYQKSYIEHLSPRSNEEMPYQHYHENQGIQRNKERQNLCEATIPDKSNEKQCKPNGEQIEGKQKFFGTLEKKTFHPRIKKCTTKPTLSKNICGNCFSQNVPVIKENLAKEIRRIIGKRERNSVFVKFTAGYDNLYHMQMSTESDYLGCLYATESATFQAMDCNDFDGFITLSVTETSNKLLQIQRLVDHAFVVVQLEKKKTC